MEEEIEEETESFTCSLTVTAVNATEEDTEVSTYPSTVAPVKEEKDMEISTSSLTMHWDLPRTPWLYTIVLICQDKNAFCLCGLDSPVHKHHNTLECDTHAAAIKEKLGTVALKVCICRYEEMKDPIHREMRDNIKLSAQYFNGV